MLGNIKDENNGLEIAVFGLTLGVGDVKPTFLPINVFIVRRRDWL